MTTSNNSGPDFPACIDHIYIGIAVACTILAFAQAAHFYFYFDQPSAISIKWSVKGSIIWAILLIGVVHLDRKYGQSHRGKLVQFGYWATVAFACGAAQVLVAISMDFVLGTASRPFLQDFLHLYNKRWLQNLLVFCLFFVWWRQALLRQAPSEKIEARDDNRETAKIKLQVDRGTHFVDVETISHVESMGNYVVVHTARQQYIVRKTLKAIQSELADFGFLQVSRSALVNRNWVETFTAHGSHRAELILRGGHAVGVGRTYWSAVKSSLKI